MKAEGVRHQSRAQSRAIARLLLCGALLIALAPVWVWYGVYYSGRLALAQQAPASEILRGFDFGPVWLETGKPGRYFIIATMPQADAASWRTTFEVLDLSRQPVFRQDEVRFIGDYQFAPGQQESSQHQFTLQKGTGYYYFRFKAHNGTFSPSAAAPPVVKFAIRQDVLTGWSLWGPAAAMLLCGLLLLGWSLRLISRIGSDAVPAGKPQPGGAPRGAAPAIR